MALFGVFAVGSVLISPLMFLFGSIRLCHPVVRTMWRPLLWVFTALRLIRIDYDGGRDIHGSVIVANHPSLIDVVIMICLFPKTLYVAKHALLRDFFMSGIVRHTSLPDDERLPAEAEKYLRKGWNVLIFPEGTRTALDSVEMRPFRRGAAQVALRNGVPVVPVGIGVSERILAKGQPPWDIGDRTVDYVLRRGEAIQVGKKDGVVRSEAVALTDRIRERIEELI